MKLDDGKIAEWLGLGAESPGRRGTKRGDGMEYRFALATGGRSILRAKGAKS